jgi:hypothetical protein
MQPEGRAAAGSESISPGAPLFYNEISRLSAQPAAAFFSIRRVPNFFIVNVCFGQSQAQRIDGKSCGADLVRQAAAKRVASTAS